MRSHELGDEEWAVIELLLPHKSLGIERVDDRRVINGIFAVSERVRLREMCRNAIWNLPPVRPRMHPWPKSC